MSAATFAIARLRAAQAEAIRKSLPARPEPVPVAKAAPAPEPETVKLRKAAERINSLYEQLGKRDETIQQIRGGAPAAPAELHVHVENLSKAADSAFDMLVDGLLEA